MENIYIVEIKDSASYRVSANGIEEAQDQALEWFRDRKPTVIIKKESNKK